MPLWLSVFVTIVLVMLHVVPIVVLDLGLDFVKTGRLAVGRRVIIWSVTLFTVSFGAWAGAFAWLSTAASVLPSSSVMYWVCLGGASLVFFYGAITLGWFASDASEQIKKLPPNARLGTPPGVIDLGKQQKR